jgi:hypothetical protein
MPNRVSFPRFTLFGQNQMPRFLCPLMLMSLFLGASIPMTFAEDAADAVYELRTYTTHPGRLPALNKRFRDHTMKLFEKHGMTNVMYWTPVDKEDTLIYVLKHKSSDAAKKSWGGSAVMRIGSKPATNRRKTARSS